MCLSENIKNFRLKKDLTQEQLASRLGVSAQAVSKWERSETYPDGALLVSLSRELGASLDELFENNYVSMPDNRTASKYRAGPPICNGARYLLADRARFYRLSRRA